MTETFYLKRGDTSPALRLALEPLDIPLDGATLRFRMRARGGALITDAPAVIDTTDPPTVLYDWQPQDTAIAGLFQAEVRVTYADGAVETFPNVGYIAVQISEDVR
jgi:hypothetical protein